MNNKESNNIVLLTPEEAAKYLGVLPLTLATWRSRKTHNLPYIKIGRLVKYKKSDLDIWINYRTIYSAVPVPLN